MQENNKKINLKNILYLISKKVKFYISAFLILAILFICLAEIYNNFYLLVISFILLSFTILLLLLINFVNIFSLNYTYDYTKSKRATIVNNQIIFNYHIPPRAHLDFIVPPYQYLISNNIKPILLDTYKKLFQNRDFNYDTLFDNQTHININCIDKVLIHKRSRGWKGNQKPSLQLGDIVLIFYHPNEDKNSTIDNIMVPSNNIPEISSLLNKIIFDNPQIEVDVENMYDTENTPKFFSDTINIGFIILISAIILMTLSLILYTILNNS